MAHPSGTARRDLVLAEIRETGGEWTAGRAQLLYRARGWGHRSTVRSDLRRFELDGELIRHDFEGRRVYTLPHQVDQVASRGLRPVVPASGRPLARALAAADLPPMRYGTTPGWVIRQDHGTALDISWARTVGTATDRAAWEAQQLQQLARIADVLRAAGFAVAWLPGTARTVFAAHRPASLPGMRYTAELCGDTWAVRDTLTGAWMETGEDQTAAERRACDLSAGDLLGDTQSFTWEQCLPDGAVWDEGTGDVTLAAAMLAYHLCEEGEGATVETGRDRVIIRYADEHTTTLRPSVPAA
jgi:hypothetical protein